MKTKANPTEKRTVLQALRQMQGCRCTFAQYTVGDGCSVCQPATALEQAVGTIADLRAALEVAQKHAAYWQWFRGNFATHPATVGLHACETPERLEAHFDAAMRAAP